MTLLAPLHAAYDFLFPRAAQPCVDDEPAIAQIRASAGVARRWTDRQLAAQMGALRTCAPSPVDVFALVVEAIRRVRGQTLYDVQLLAGLALARGSVVEMATGEGKTLAAALPAALLALGGQGVHVVTPNRYLAGRDYAELAPVFRLLGLSVGLVRDSVPPDEKRPAYAADVTYATGYELAFDYLRDQLALAGRRRPELGGELLRQLRGQVGPDTALVQRGQAVAIIDEIDSVLLDEAGMPLILSGMQDAGLGVRGSGFGVRDTETESRIPHPVSPYHHAACVAGDLTPDIDYHVQARRRSVRLTELGVARAHGQLAAEVAAQLKRPWQTYVEQALIARLLHRRDADYVVQAGEVQLVDPFTGRIFADRTWCDGLHQAIEVKEGLEVRPERYTSARISRQRYFARYATICGMSGTLQGSEAEFRRQYQLPVVVVPLNRPCQRRLLEARYFAHADAKWRAVTEEVQAVHATQRPILAGTATIEASQILARRLDVAGVAYRLLNGTQDQDEARIVAQAGQAGAVTIATNMAGRGTDIRLEPAVVQLGGLHVIGTEHHESGRVDRQLLGRAGRQGDPGSGRLFAAADDALLRRYAPDLARRHRGATDPLGEIHADLTGVVADAQHRAERAAYLQRRQLLAHDRWLEEWLGGKE